MTHSPTNIDGILVANLIGERAAGGEGAGMGGGAPRLAWGIEKIDEGAVMGEDKRYRPPCPVCKRDGAVAVIQYGLPTGPPAEGAVLGGCVVGDDDAKWVCVRCGIEWSATVAPRPTAIKLPVRRAVARPEDLTTPEAIDRFVADSMGITVEELRERDDPDIDLSDEEIQRLFHEQ